LEDERFVVERRISRRVHTYWQSLCRGRRMPLESDIDPDALGDDWPNCFLLQTRDIDHIEQFNFTYLGDGILSAYQRYGLDTDNLYMIGPNAFYLAPQFNHVVRTIEPLIDDGFFIGGDGRKVSYRQCLLPLGEGRKVEAIFGAMLFRTSIK
jgi:hypothetical protein